jgi:hypothetical protein
MNLTTKLFLRILKKDYFKILKKKQKSKNNKKNYKKIK